MDDNKQKITKLEKDFSQIKEKVDIDALKLEMRKLEAKSTDPKLWQNQAQAKVLMQNLGDLKKQLDSFEDVEKGLKNLKEIDQHKAEQLSKHLVNLEKVINKLKLTSFLSGEYDSKNAVVTIQAGQGGTEAMDWVSMIYRMYIKFCEKRGWVTQMIDASAGEEAGFKSVTFKVSGMYAYGYLKAEGGTHRLVRQSPFNADRLRQTSFARVEVLPELEDVDLPDIKIRDEDLDWQFFRASSQGGQNVQKVSSAVRLKHKPSGIIVTSQTQRHQEQNRNIALDLLRGRLWAQELERAAKEKSDLKGEYTPASWGTQIRSYVLHPYKMVKDLRTKHETKQAEDVLDGELDGFIEAELSLIG